MRRAFLVLFALCLVSSGCSSEPAGTTAGSSTTLQEAPTTTTGTSTAGTSSLPANGEGSESAFLAQVREVLASQEVDVGVRSDEELLVMGRYWCEVADSCSDGAELLEAMNAELTGSYADGRGHRFAGGPWFADDLPHPWYNALGIVWASTTSLCPDAELTEQLMTEAEAFREEAEEAEGTPAERQELFVAEIRGEGEGVSAAFGLPLPDVTRYYDSGLVLLGLDLCRISEGVRLDGEMDAVGLMLMLPTLYEQFSEFEAPGETASLLLAAAYHICPENLPWIQDGVADLMQGS